MVIPLKLSEYSLVYVEETIRVRGYIPMPITNAAPTAIVSSHSSRKF
jgi:hypothetical protein